MDSRLSGLVPDWIRRGYLRQFGAAVVVILVVLSVVLGGVYAIERQSQGAEVRDTLSTDADRKAERVAEWRTQHETTTRLAAKSESLRPDEGGLNITLESLTRSMPDDVVAMHLVNWQEGKVLGTSDTNVNLTADELPWLTSLDVEDDPITLVRMSESYRVDNETRVSFMSKTQFGFGYMAVVEVSVTDSFDFREPVDGARTRLLYRNATTLSDDESNRTNQRYEGPSADVLFNATEYDRSTAAIAEASNLNTSVVRSSGTVAGYASVPGERMVVVTTASDDVFGVGADTKTYLALIFLLVALSLGAIGAVMERPVARSVSRLTDRAEALEEGDLDVDFETGRVDEIGTLYDRFASMRDSLAERIDAIESAREEARAEADAARQEAEAARQEAEAFNEHLETTADEYGETIRACADGDLTRRLEPDDESEAMAEIARAFNEMLDDLEATLARVRSFADDVADSTTDATTATRRARDTGSEVNEEAGDIAADALEQDEYLTDVTEEMNDLSATVQEVAATADQVAELAAGTESVADEGSEAAEEAMTEMETIEAATAETADEIRDLESEVERVAEIVDLIDDIADQTNTLALNASIEAARAGESGQGFAVVADEVKQLAEETRAATEDIDDLLSALSERTGSAVDDMESMRDDVVSGVETTQGALDALDGIADQVRNTNQGVQEISDATDDQADSAQEVVSLVDRVADISERTSSRAEDLADTADEQATTLDEVTHTAESIESQAAELSDMLDELTLDADAAAAPGDPDGDRPVPVDPDGDSDLVSADGGSAAATRSEERTADDSPADPDGWFDDPDA